MIRRFLGQETGRLLGLAGLCMALSLVAQLMLVHPRQGELRRLSADRQRLLSRIAEESRSDQLDLGLASLLGVKELTELTGAQAGEPLTYVGKLLDRSRLTRLDITTDGVKETDLLVRTSFTVRVLGGYPNVLGFVKSLESGTRVATVDAFEMEHDVASDRLETRLSLSIWDPKK
jgi:hypothetical protein